MIRKLIRQYLKKLKRDAKVAIGKLINSSDDPESIKKLNDIQNMLSDMFKT